MRTAEVTPGRRLGRRPADEHHARQGGRDVRVADAGQRLGDRRVVPQDDRLGRHQAAGGVGGVGQQPPNRFGLLGLHQLQQHAGLGVGKLGEQVRRVVGGHGLQHVGGAVPAQVRQQGALVGLGELLEHVGEPLVVQRVDDLVAALLRQRGQRAGDVGRPHRLEDGEQPFGPLPVGQGQAGHRPPRHHAHLVPAGQPAPSRPHGKPADHPVAGARGLDRGVDDDHLLAGVLEPDRGVEQLADDESLAPALGEAAQAHRPGCERDRRRVDAGDAQHRHEDPPPRREFDDEAEHPRRVGVDPQGHHGVADLADPLAVRAEDGEAHHACDEDARGGHAGSLMPTTTGDDRRRGGSDTRR